MGHPTFEIWLTGLREEPSIGEEILDFIDAHPDGVTTREIFERFEKELTPAIQNWMQSLLDVIVPRYREKVED